MPQIAWFDWLGPSGSQDIRKTYVAEGHGRSPGSRHMLLTCTATTTYFLFFSLAQGVCGGHTHTVRTYLQKPANGGLSCPEPPPDLECPKCPDPPFYLTVLPLYRYKRDKELDNGLIALDIAEALRGYSITEVFIHDSWVLGEKDFAVVWSVNGQVWSW